MRKKMTLIARRRRGAVLVYVAIIMVAMMAFCSLAVDLSRYEGAQVQIHNASMAAARAGANDMASGGDATTTPAAALAVATANKVDGGLIDSSMVTVQYGKWNGTTFTAKAANKYNTCNSVRVTIVYDVPLAFAKILGLTSKTASKYSTAQEITSTDTPHVFATGDLWLAGEPAGTHGSQADPTYLGLHTNPDHQYPDVIAGTPGKNTNGGAVTAANYSNYEPYASPVVVGFTVTPGARITITNASGIASYDHATPAYLDPTANGGTSWVCHDYAANNVSEHGIADATMPIGSMNAVFLGSGVPDGIATVPSSLDFSTQAQRDYVALQPKLQQPFYVGNGQTTTGKQQSLLVPPNATRMFMGVMDAWEWDNNLGAYDCTVTQIQILTVE